MPATRMEARLHALTADLLRATWPRHTAKQAARAANGPVSTAKSWVQRRFRPDADTLLTMARESAELRAELIRLLGEWDADAMGAGAVAASPGALAGGSGGQAGPSAAVAGSARGRERG